MPTIRSPASNSWIRSTNKNGYRWGRVARISSIVRDVISRASLRLPLLILPIEFLDDLFGDIKRIAGINDDLERRLAPFIHDRGEPVFFGDCGGGLVDFYLIFFDHLLLFRLDFSIEVLQTALIIFELHAKLLLLLQLLPRLRVARLGVVFVPVRFQAL